MSSLAYLLVGLVLVLVQGTMHRFTSGLDDLVIGSWHVGDAMHGTNPSLVLLFVVYLGIHEHSMARGALMAFALGWIVDIIGGGPAFLFRFSMVGVWWTFRAASSRVSTQSTMMRIPLAFVASLVESTIILTLLAIFGADNQRPLELASIVLPRAIGTAIAAPLVFALAHRLSSENSGPTASSNYSGNR